MGIFVAIILGVVQGLTEFLPVSSSGHLVLLQKVFGLEGDNMLFNIVMHLGSLMAVIICYRKKLWAMVKQPFSPAVINLVVATIPTVIIFFLFRDFFEESFNGGYLAFCFIITAIFLVLCDWAGKSKSTKPIDKMTAVVMGLFQGFAIIPGVSRSGSTLTGGLCMGADREKVADFSFLMSIPIILGSLVLELIEGGFVGVNVLPLIVGFVFSFLSGLFAIKFMLRVVKQGKFYPFVIYLILIAIVSVFV